MQQVEYITERQTTTQCPYCECAIVEDEQTASYTHWGTYSGSRKKRRGGVSVSVLWVRVWLLQCCDRCAQQEEAICEARADQRRFTPISTVLRCTCGCAQYQQGNYPWTGHCLRCQREMRMLKRELAEARLAHRLIVDLKREARRGNEVGRVA